MLCPRLNELIVSYRLPSPFDVADVAPSTYQELRGNAGTLVVWSGGSENTIYGDEQVNWKLRAIHDYMHIKYGLSFSLEGEITLAVMTANMFGGGRIGDILYAEIALQARYFHDNGHFPAHQYEFVKQNVKGV